MPNRDPRIDTYIAKSADFARPILEYLRETIHTAVPDVEESIKWGMPSFDYKGPLCNLAAFKAHCALSFWKGSLLGIARSDDAMGHFGRITSKSDLPPKKDIVALVRKVAELNEQGVKVVRPRKAAPKPLEMPDDLQAALRRNRKAREAFEKFPPGQRREYIAWITEAKRDETRSQRLKQAVEWISEGKPRNWKYMKK